MSGLDWIVCASVTLGAFLWGWARGWDDRRRATKGGRS